MPPFLPLMKGFRYVGKVGTSSGFVSTRIASSSLIFSVVGASTNRRPMPRGFRIRPLNAHPSHRSGQVEAKKSQLRGAPSV